MCARALERITRAWALLGGGLLLLIVLVTSVNAAAFGLDKLARLFGANVAGLAGYEDFVRLTVSAAALMMFPFCQLKRGHVAVDIFVDMTPVPVQRGLDFLALLLLAFLAIFLAYWMVLGAAETRADGNLSPVLGWPEWPFFIPGIISLVLWAAVCFSQLGAQSHDD